jgi:hypothetical protein
MFLLDYDLTICCFCGDADVPTGSVRTWLSGSYELPACLAEAIILFPQLINNFLRLILEFD